MSTHFYRFKSLSKSYEYFKTNKSLYMIINDLSFVLLSIVIYVVAFCFWIMILPKNTTLRSSFIYHICIHLQCFDADWLSIITIQVALNNVLRHLYFVYIYSFNDALRSIAYKPLYLQLSLPTIIFAGNLCIQYFSCHIFLHVIFHMILLANISLQMGKCSWEKRENELERKYELADL